MAEPLIGLGWALLGTGNVNGAQARFERALRVTENTVGSAHPRAADALDGLGQVALRRGDHALARQHFQRGLDIRERSLGPDHPTWDGGVKLAGALDRFGVDPRDRIALDVGASTGGFTDWLPQRGARRVYALDVGSGQIHYRLRKDPRVVVMEKINARNLVPGMIPEPVSLAVVDVSFISLRLVLPPLAKLLPEAADLLARCLPSCQ